jgi:hypothetical protein
VAKPNHVSNNEEAAPQVTTIQRPVGAVRAGQKKEAIRQEKSGLFGEKRAGVSIWYTLIPADHV